jgi:hypothetical protein
MHRRRSPSDFRKDVIETLFVFQSAAMLRTSGCEQCEQRRASSGISLKHSGHFFVVGSAGTSDLCIRARRALTGSTTKKYTAAATSRNETNAFMKSPKAKMLPLIVKLIAEKSGLPTIAAINADFAQIDQSPELERR